MTRLLTWIENPLLRWLLALAWTALISVLLVQSEQNPMINTGIPPGEPTLEREIVFTTAHLIAFSITSALWFWAWFGHINLRTSLILGVAIAIVIGGVTEYLQSFVPDRQASLFDLLANCIGALGIAYFIWRKRDQLLSLNQPSEGSVSLR